MLCVRSECAGYRQPLRAPAGTDAGWLTDVSVAMTTEVSMASVDEASADDVLCVRVCARETLKSFSADVAVNRPVINGRVIYGCGKHRCKSVISFPQFVTSDRTSVGRIIRDTSTQYIKEIGLIMSPIAYTLLRVI